MDDRQIINVGATANDGTGDRARVAFGKANANFAVLWTALASTAASGVNNDIKQLTGLTTPLSQLQGGTGATALKTALTTLIAGLPTSLPASPGQLWLNSGVLALS